MATRNLLHRNKLECFKQWLISKGEIILEPKGMYEVLRWKNRKGRHMPIVFDNLRSDEHLSANDAAAPFILRWLKERKQDMVDPYTLAHDYRCYPARQPIPIQGEVDRDSEIDFSVTLDGGKYRYILYKNGASEVLRNSKTWCNTTGDKLILAMAQRIRELEAMRLVDSSSDNCLNGHIPIGWTGKVYCERCGEFLYHEEPVIGSFSSRGPDGELLGPNQEHTSQPTKAQVPEGWSLGDISDPHYEGISLRRPGIAYCVWRDKDPTFFLFLDAMLSDTPKPNSSKYDGQNGNGYQPQGKRLINPPKTTGKLPNIDELAQIIREVDGTHSLGAGTLAEAIIETLHCRGWGNE